MAVDESWGMGSHFYLEVWLLPKKTQKNPPTGNSEKIIHSKIKELRKEAQNHSFLFTTSCLLWGGSSVAFYHLSQVCAYHLLTFKTRVQKIVCSIKMQTRHFGFSVYVFSPPGVDKERRGEEWRMDNFSKKYEGFSYLATWFHKHAGFFIIFFIFFYLFFLRRPFAHSQLSRIKIPTQELY